MLGVLTGPLEALEELAPHQTRAHLCGQGIAASGQVHVQFFSPADGSEGAPCRQLIARSGLPKAIQCVQDSFVVGPALHVALLQGGEVGGIIRGTGRELAVREPRRPHQGGSSIAAPVLEELRDVRHPQSCCLRRQSGSR